ncbi:MAG: sodium:proton antiporter [Cyanobacteria bacterium SIG31]|nr:sodium:proton antiporter [Cyanobacteria bacterium SIG31]
MEIICNPAVISIILLCVLCLKHINVLLAIIVSTIVAGLLAGMDISKIMNTFISGMGDNSETALSYILLGTFAATMAHSGFTNKMSSKISDIISGKKWILLTILALIAMASQNIVPIHIAFIPIIIPPLLATMNTLNVDRRAIASVLAFGLKMPYITIPVGFGLIFQNLIADNLLQNGVNILRSDVWKSTLILGLGMIVALLVAILITYKKPRNYEQKNLVFDMQVENNCSNYTVLIIVIAAISTFVVQLLTQSLPLGALVGLGIIFSFNVVSKKKMDHMMNEGIYLMGYVAFVMLVAAGFASVLKNSGAIAELVNLTIGIMPENILLTSFIILLLGLFITIGIGTSFGTIPILAVLFVPICLKLGFNTSQIVVLIAAAAALGDAGSPASDTTLGPTSGLNADGQHDHIYDTCIPTFLHFNTALIIFALLGIYLLG